MGLAETMGLASFDLTVGPRAMQRIGCTKAGTAAFSVVLGPLDEVSHRLSKGRFTIGRSLGGLPVAMLTTTGRRSGQLRTSPVNVIPVGGDVGLVASNYGRGRPPAWALNLRANPRAVVTHKATDYDVEATEVDGNMYETIFAAALTVYPGYAAYRRRSTGVIPIFLLEEAQ